jgi:hypothetical protein
MHAPLSGSQRLFSCVSSSLLRCFAVLYFALLVQKGKHGPGRNLVLAVAPRAPIYIYIYIYILYIYIIYIYIIIIYNICTSRQHLHRSLSKTRDCAGASSQVYLAVLYFCVTSTEGQKLTRQEARAREYAGASFTLLY